MLKVNFAQRSSFKTAIAQSEVRNDLQRSRSGIEYVVVYCAYFKIVAHKVVIELQIDAAAPFIVGIFNHKSLSVHIKGVMLPIQGIAFNHMRAMTNSMTGFIKL